MSDIRENTSLLIEGLKTVSINYWNDKFNDGAFSSKKYTYKTLDTLRIGDLVTVNVHGQYKVVKVVEVHLFPHLDEAKHWIVDKVDTTRHARILQMEEILRSKLQEIRNKNFREQALEALKESSGMSDSEVKEITSLSTQFLIEEKEVL